MGLGGLFCGLSGRDLELTARKRGKTSLVYPESFVGMKKRKSAYVSHFPIQPLQYATSGCGRGIEELFLRTSEQVSLL